MGLDSFACSVTIWHLPPGGHFLVSDVDSILCMSLKDLQKYPTNPFVESVLLVVLLQTSTALFLSVCIMRASPLLSSVTIAGCETL